MNRTSAFLAGAVILFFTAGISCAAPGVGDELFISVTNKFGDVFTKLKVAQILGDGLVLENASGQMKVKYADLPPAVRQKYQPLAAAAVEKEEAERAVTAASLAHEQELQAGLLQLQAAQQAKEQAEGIASGELVQCLRIGVPNQDWTITMMNPGLKALDRRVDGDLLALHGLPGANGVNLSLFVEPATSNGTNHTDAFNYYWSQMANGSLMDTNSMRIKKNEKFVIVGYTVQGQPNVNYYFAFQGRWVDVHISKWPVEAGDDRLFAEFEEHLSYGE
ncbi:MAG TPA: hypothetical protein VKJ65_08485 [Phycisphaerae bacterium]|nr:hypothetical protein [Phycisphaerae bacterium]